MIIYIYTILLLFAVSTISYAATGDVIFSCDFSGAGSTPQQIVQACSGVSTGSTLNTWATVEATGGPVANGKYVRLHKPSSGSAGTISVDHPNRDSVTMVWYTKFEGWPIMGANIKETRNYIAKTDCGAGGNEPCYIGATISAYCAGCSTINTAYDRRFYISPGESASVNYTASALNNSSNGGCTGSSNPYTCTDPVHIIFNWSTDSWSTWGFGNNVWHKMRYYLKPPTTGNADGSLQLWIDDTEIFTTTNLKADAGVYHSSGAQLSTVDFFPSEAATDDYYHSLANITIYEGYVPPEGATPVNGVCGSSNGGTFASAPTTTAIQITQCESVQVMTKERLAHSISYLNLTPPVILGP